MTATEGPGPGPGLEAGTSRQRILGSLVLFAGLVVLFVALPIYLLGFLGSHGVSTGASDAQFAAGGTVLAGLFAITYLLRPSRYFGVALIARGAGGVAYLVLLAPYATAHAIVSGDVAATLGASTLFLWLAASPIVGVIAGVFVLWSDLRSPEVRLRGEFPAEVHAP